MPSLSKIGLIPAAGKGTRLNLPFPKELYPLPSNGRMKYVIEDAVQNFRDAGIRKIVVIIRPRKAEQIMEVLTSYSDIDFCYVLQKQDDGYLSTAIISAVPWIDNSQVFFQMPDTILTPNPFLKVGEEDLQFITFQTDELFRFAQFNHTTFEIIEKPLGQTHGVSWGALVWSPVFTRFLASCWAKEKDFAKIMNAFQGSKSRLCQLESYHDLGTLGAVLNARA